MTYDLNGDSTISNEDIPLIGFWEDFTGSDFKPQTANSRNQQMWGGHENQLFGTNPDIQNGTKINDLTDRGNHKTTTRTRRIKRRVQFDKDGRAESFT